MKKQIDQLAQGFLEKMVDIPTYTLKWNQMVKDTMKIIDQMEKYLSELEK